LHEESSKKVWLEFQPLAGWQILTHMEYEGSIGLVTRKMKKKMIADFDVLGLFMAKTHDLSINFVFVCHAPLPLPSFAKIYTTPTAYS
jgi:hypothetical protein